MRYMQNHCIDVFFAFNQYPIHVITAGSLIPDELNDILRNRTLQEEIERNERGETPCRISSNMQYIQSLIERDKSFVDNHEPTPEQIIKRFKFYAEQGFFSYDCSEVREDGTAIYRLIVRPEQVRQVNYQLPQFAPKGFAEIDDTTQLPESFEM